MSRLIVLSLAIGSLLTGCRHSLMDMCGRAYLKPQVTLVDTTETKESPSRAYVILPSPMPVFPHNLCTAGIRGLVVVRVTIGKDGVVKDAFVLKSTQKEFEEPSITAVKCWRFTEMREFGVNENLGAVVDCTIEFGFEDEEEPNQPAQRNASTGSVTNLKSPARRG